MLYARHPQTDAKILATPDASGRCLACNQPLTSKTGLERRWHWSHAPGDKCEGDWHYDETPWHLGWKEFFDPEYVEVRVGKRVYDVQCEDGGALEFQNRMDEKIIQEREAKTPNMVWLFNFSESKGRVQFTDKKAERFWIRRFPPTLRDCESPVYLDLGSYTRPAVEVVEECVAFRPQQRRILRVDAMPEKITNDQFDYWESKESNDWSQFRSMMVDNAGHCTVMTIPQFFQEVGLMSRVRPVPDFSGKRNTSEWKVWPCNLPATWERERPVGVDHLQAYLRADYQLHFLPKDAQGEYEVSHEFKDLQLANIYADRGAGFIKMPVFKRGQQTGEWVVGFWSPSLGASCPSNQVNWVNEYLTLSEADVRILAFRKSGV